MEFLENSDLNVIFCHEIGRCLCFICLIYNGLYVRAMKAEGTGGKNIQHKVA